MLVLQTEGLLQCEGEFNPQQASSSLTEHHSPTDQEKCTPRLSDPAQ